MLTGVDHDVGASISRPYVLRVPAYCEYPSAACAPPDLPRRLRGRRTRSPRGWPPMRRRLDANMTIDETMPPAAPKVADFEYPDFYRAMVERERLQVARDEAKWTEKHTSPVRKIEVLLNFGCNVRQTPHLMREA